MAIADSIKRRSHRAASEKQVEAVLRATGPGAPLGLLVRLLQNVEKRLGKPYVEFSVGERRKATELVAITLEELLAVASRRGRPRKRPQGIIASEMGKVGAARRRAQGLPRPDEVEQKLRYHRLGVFAGTEKKGGELVRDLDGIKAALDYIRSCAMDPESVMSRGRVPRGAWDDLVDFFKLDPTMKDALKKQYGRWKRSLP